MIVLVNKYTASASELVCGALKDNGRAIVIGEKTFGKGSVQSLIRIPNQGAILLTIGEFYTPNNQKIDCVGIAPHIQTADFSKIENYFNQ